jgi:O-antigen ligase
MRDGRLFGARSATALEISLIAIVLFCLPLFEAPKNVFSALFLIAWVVNAIRGRSLGRASPFDFFIACLAAILWVAPLFSQFGDTITPVNSAPRWTLLALSVLAASRLDYSRGQALAIMAALMAGGMVAVAESFWVWSLNGKAYPEFRSVGHVNHSSMYSLIPLAAGIGALYLREWWLRALGMAAIISSLAFLPPSKSLVGGVAITAILVTGLGVWTVRRWSLRGLVLAVCAAVVVVAGALATPPAAGFRGELVARVTGDDIFSHRDKILNSALAVWDRHPLLGTGWFSFGVATSEEEVRAALADDGFDYDPNAYAHFPHGHNLWTTMLIERGLLGVGLVTALLLLYFRTFVPLALSRDQLDPSERGAAVAALLVAVGFAVAGLGNTTMMNEHGHAGMALIAVGYGYLRGRGLVGTNLRT